MLAEIITGSVALVALVVAWRKSIPERESIVVKTTMELLAPLRERVASLEREVQHLREENSHLRAWATALVAQVVAAGQTPVPFESVKSRVPTLGDEIVREAED